MVVLYFLNQNQQSQKKLLKKEILIVVRMVVMPVTTVQEFRHQALTVLEKYIDQDALKENHYCLY